MIEINLIPGKKQKAARGKGLGLKLALPDFRGLIASIKNPWLIAASASAVVVNRGGRPLFLTLRTPLREVPAHPRGGLIQKPRVGAGAADERRGDGDHV